VDNLPARFARPTWAPLRRDSDSDRAFSP